MLKKDFHHVLRYYFLIFFLLVFSPFALFAQHEQHGAATPTETSFKTTLYQSKPVGKKTEQQTAKKKPARAIKPLSLPHGPAHTINLVVAYKTVYFAGKTRRAIAVNNQIPAPTLRFKEGERVTINVYNHLDKGTSIHWHGILVPWQMDGVENVSQKAIPPGGVFHYRFTLHQSGTYWYHAHADVQEQEGLYGAFLIDPKTPPPYRYTKDYVVVLSDWSNIPANQIFANLKKDGDYFSPKFPLQPSLSKFIHDYRSADAKERKSLINDYKMMQQMRMSIYDLSDVAYDAFLLNGQPKMCPWTAQVKVGDVVRLRFIGAGGSTIFRVKIQDTTLQMVHIQGNDVKPFPISDFDIAPGETYDVLVSIQKSKPYIIYAESIDTVGAAVGALVTSSSQTVNYQQVPPFPEPLPTTRQMMANMMMSEEHQGSSSMPDHSMIKQGKSASKMQGMNMPPHSMAHAKAGNSKESMSSSKKSMPMNHQMDMSGMKHSMPMTTDDKNSKSKESSSSSKSMNSEEMHGVHGISDEKNKSSTKNDAMESNKNGEEDSMSMSMPSHSMAQDSSTNANKQQSTSTAKGGNSKESMSSNKKSMPMNHQMDMSGMKHSMPMTTNDKNSKSKVSLKTKNSKEMHAMHGISKGKNKSSTVRHSMMSKNKSMSMPSHSMTPSSSMHQSMSMSTVQTKDSMGSMDMDMSMDKPMHMPTEPSIIGDSIIPMDKKYSAMTMGTKYQELTAAIKTNDPHKPIDGVIRMELFGYMDHFIWFINGLPEYKAKPILIEPSKRYRIIFTNNSMMRHPMHIHGHWFILRNGHGSYDPLLHTIEVPPGATAVADFDTDASGQWFFHCHHLYHMMAGMARVFQYETIIEVANGLRKPEYEIASTGYYNRPIVRVDEQIPIDLSLVKHPIGHHAGLYKASFLELSEDPFHNAQELSFKGLYGPDYHKLELYTEDAEVNKGSIEYADMDIFYWHLISQFWAVKGGVNYFYRPGGPYWQPGIGIEGLAPYFIDTNIRTYYHQGSVKFDAELSRDTQLFNNFLVRTGIRSILATKTVVQNELGNGLNQMRYIVRPYYRLMPGLNVYAEYEYDKDYGAFKRIRQAKGENTTETTVSLGLAFLL
ncbi:multicopper oxidase domain-containing protein [Legionella resiliens]|uniref:Multicopper oxidase domain-containing protein n=1 Tax=Legionella resiliens TaxID=2905958 RepID=A0ABS8WZL0_9GAMM|nr:MULTISPECIES: multicopper oxidase domain-containing protein [unclassified Legionella]MCE0722765.1 multicopper oxidase domain-containing protein [Legionella sp. 9fVS26]MCE3531918.1 multicopper oxidase domain-containing protein [Legionella sp. 8cVS16]